MALRLTTYGGAETVTGSNFLIETESGERILVDCGLLQGSKEGKENLHEPFPYDASSIRSLVITHAHLDHIGRAPCLVRAGFSGSVVMTEPTRDLSELMLYDSLRIHEQEARETGAPLPYSRKDVQDLLSRVVTVPYRQEHKVTEGLSILLRDTGHILGSASVRIKDTSGVTLAITGDIGNSPSAFLPDAEPIPDADAVLIESVYGDRANPEKPHRTEKLKRMLQAAVKKGGTILIPSFSIERTQLMLYELSNFFSEGALPKVPVFLDAPLAISVTDVYRKWGNTYFKQEAKEEMHREGDIFSFPFLTMTDEREDSEAIREVKGPKIILAGAGMSHGGRIAKWEARYLPDPASTLLMVGYQSPGTLGRALQDGAKNVRIKGQWVRVRARVETLYGWSGHTDRDGLLSFAKMCLPKTKTFIVGMGEPSSARFLAQRIHDYLGRPAIVPMEGQTFLITKEGARFEKNA